jgi:hypothetical protein
MFSLFMRKKIDLARKILLAVVTFACCIWLPVVYADDGAAPVPMLQSGKGVNWWFVFKLNAAKFPQCGGADAVRACPFGGDVQNYAFGQQFLYASDAAPALQKGGGCVGTSTADPVGATFDQVYNGAYFYLIWNDQFYDDPKIAGCTKSCASPWGHSKGMLAWDASGAGFVMQVSTPSWPAAGSIAFPRASDGNTLGCVKDDDVKVSQHFFALKLSKSDVLEVLSALQNASVATDPGNPQLAKLGGPPEIRDLAAKLGKKSSSSAYTTVQLSSGVGLISKPSKLQVPPWQMVSALLGGVPLRTATWWAAPYIYSTTATTKLACWSDTLGKPGAVEIATSGQWQDTVFGLKGGPGGDFNHAKIGVSTGGEHHFAIFADMNQQGTRSGPNCASSQNGRGGLFFVVDNKELADGVGALIKGATAGTTVPAKLAR